MEKPDIDRTVSWLFILLAGALAAVAGSQASWFHRHRSAPRSGSAAIAARPGEEHVSPDAGPVGSGDSPAPVHYLVQPLDGGKGVLTPRAINDVGQIAGSIENNKGDSQAFLWQEGKLTLLPTLGGSNSGAHAVNNRGQVVGFAETRDGPRHPAMWQSGKVRNLGSLYGKSGEAWDINDRGEVVGTLGDVHSLGFVYRQGRMALVRVQRGFYVISADAINNQGVIAGRMAPRGVDPFDHAVVHVCLVEHGRGVGFGPAANSVYGNAPSDINDSDTVVGMSSYVEGYSMYTIQKGQYEALARDDYHGVCSINDSGQYVGWQCAGSVIQDGPYRAILWQNGQKYDLNHLISQDSGWVLEYAYGINNRGQIVGTGYRPGSQDRVDGKESAVLLTPVRPPPGVKPKGTAMVSAPDQRRDGFRLQQHGAMR
jgi:probable HAF family extracellular repeat protein